MESHEIDDENQKEINKLGRDLEKKFTEIIVAQESTPNSHVATIAALSQTMANVAVNGFGDNAQIVANYALQVAMRKAEQNKDKIEAK